MKKNFVKVAVVLIITFICGGTFATSFEQSVTAVLSSDLKMIFNGERFIPTEDNGTQIAPIIYNGRTYLPIRPLAEKLGLSIYWDGNTKTISINSGLSGGVTGTTTQNNYEKNLTPKSVVYNYLYSIMTQDVKMQIRCMDMYGELSNLEEACKFRNVSYDTVINNIKAELQQLNRTFESTMGSNWVDKFEIVEPSVDDSTQKCSVRLNYGSKIMYISTLKNNNGEWFISDLIKENLADKFFNDYGR